MAFDAGSVVGHFTLDTSGYTSGAEKVNKHTTGMTGSILKANIAYDLMKKAVAAVANFLKGSVAEYTASEKATAQLEAVLKSTGGAAGVTENQVLTLANSLARLTTFQDDTIVEAENLLLTFTKIGRDTFPGATKAVLDLSVAMGQDLKSSAVQIGKSLNDPVQGLTALRRVGVSFSDAQETLIKRLASTNHLAEAQGMILAELNKEFGGSAAAIRDTFGGALTALDTQFGEIKETFGKYIATVGRPFVETTIGMATSVNDFLNSSSGMAQIESVLTPVVSILAVAFDIAKQLFGYVKTFAIGVWNDLKDSFTGLVGKGNESNTVFLILGGAVKIVSIALAILAKMVKFGIDWLFNMISVIKDSAVVLYDLGDALLHPFDKSKWEKVGKDVSNVYDSIKNTASVAFEDIKDVVDTTIKEFRTLGTDAPKIGTQLQVVYTGAASAIGSAFTALRGEANAIADASNDLSGAITNVSDQAMSKAEQMSAHWDREARAMETSTNDFSMEATKSWGKIFDDLTIDLTFATRMFGVFSDESRKAFTDLVTHIQSGANIMISMFSSAFSQILDMYNMTLANEQTLLDNDYKAKNKVQQKIVDDENIAYEGQKKIIEDTILDETAKQIALADLEAQHTDNVAQQKAKQQSIDDAYNAKIAAIKKKQFEANKAASIVGVIISTAQAIMQGYAQLGPLGGTIAAAILIGLGVAQIAIIASQPTPDFSAATGGVFPANHSILVGEQGPEIVTLGQTSRIIPNGESFGGNGISVNAKFYGDINSDVDMDVASYTLAMRLRRAVRQ